MEMKISGEGTYVVDISLMSEMFEILHGSLDRGVHSTAVVKHKDILECTECCESSHIGCVTYAHARWPMSSHLFYINKVYISIYCRECSLNLVTQKARFISDSVHEKMDEHRNYCTDTPGKAWHLTKDIG